MTAPAFRLRILPFPTIVEYEGMVILTWQSTNGNRWADKIGRFMNEGGRVAIAGNRSESGSVSVPGPPGEPNSRD